MCQLRHQLLKAKRGQVINVLDFRTLHPCNYSEKLLKTNIYFEIRLKS